MEKLLIPLSTKVMLVGAIPEKKVLSTLSYLYELMNADCDDSPNGEIEPDIMSVTQFTEEDKGAYLHFSLPDALTKGRQEKGNDDVIYPAVPNRWLITRIWTSEGKKLQTKCFIIEGEVLQMEREGTGLHGKAGRLYNLRSAAYPYPQDADMPYRYLGRTYPGQTDPSDLPEITQKLDRLTAVAPANPCFAAYFPDCCNVFGFFDDLKDDKGAYLTNITLSYTVCGWYAEAEDDILKTYISAEKCMNDLSLQIPENMKLPASTLCHGLISDILWVDENTDYTDGIPYDLKEPQLAVGNTSMEALAAFGEAKMPRGFLNERMSNILLCDAKEKLYEENGLLKCIDEIHKARFGSQSKIRKIMIKEKAEENQEKYLKLKKKREEAGFHPEVFKPFVDFINETEVLRHSLQEDLKDKQEQLYDIFYKYVYRTHLDEDNNIDPKKDEIIALYERKVKELAPVIGMLRNRIASLAKDMMEKEEALKNQLNEDDFSLIDQNEQRFWEPNDPVLMLLGVDRDYSHGSDGRFSEDNSVVCRSIEQRITRITIEPMRELLPDGVTVLAKELFDHKEIDSVVEKHNLPPECVNIVDEGCLLSPGFSVAIADLIAEKQHITEPEKIQALAVIIRKLQTVPVNGEIYKELNKQRLCQSAGFDGVFPEIYAVVYWKQPWNPLYLCWQLSFYPDPNVLKEEPDLENWTLVDEDYVFSGDIMKPENKLVYTGRTVITPYAAEAAAEMIKDVIKEDQLRNDIKNMSILSQKLNGFHEKLLMRNLQIQTPISLRKLDDSQLKELISGLLMGYSYEKPEFNKIFLPIRAGYLELNEVHIVDNFGQTMQIKPLSVVVAEDFRYTKSSSERFIMLPPRILQPLRLNFQWLYNEATPLCGWLLPNHVEKSIHCFSKEGVLLGSLQSVLIGDQPVVWKLPPYEGGKTGELPGDIDETLYRMLGHLLKISREEHYNILEDLLMAIDTSLWNINPSSGQLFQELSLYVGRPLAVVRSKVKLELLGNERQCKTLERSVRDPGEFTYPHIDKAHFRVNVGRRMNHNDGLVGFFVDEDYTKIHLSGSTSESKHEYFNNDNYVKLCPGKEEAPTELTFLMDCAGCIDLVSGILPVKSVKLEEDLVQNSLNRLYLTIFAAPLLTDIYDISIPFPKTSGKQFSWISLDETGKLSEKTELHHTSEQGFFPEKPFEAIEGWLKLSLSDK